MNIYVMKNFTLQETYFGKTEGETKAEVQKHKVNDESPVGHWKWGEEDIKWGEIQKDLHEELAESFISALRKEPPEDGWVLVVGGAD